MVKAPINSKKIVKEALKKASAKLPGSCKIMAG